MKLFGQLVVFFNAQTESNYALHKGAKYVDAFGKTCTCFSQCTKLPNLRGRGAFGPEGGGLLY